MPTLSSRLQIVRTTFGGNHTLLVEYGPQYAVFRVQDRNYAASRSADGKNPETWIINLTRIIRSQTSHFLNCLSGALSGSGDLPQSIYTSYRTAPNIASGHNHFQTIFKTGQYSDSRKLAQNLAFSYIWITLRFKNSF